MKIFPVVVVLCMLAGPNSLGAQLLQYEPGGGASRTSDPRRDGGYKRELYLDGDRADLPSDLSHAKWARTKLPFFKSMDADGDTVLSEYDLRRVPLQEARSWSAVTVEEIFTFWRPNVDDHFQDLGDRILERSEGHFYLEEAAGDALDDIDGAIRKLGLDDHDLGSVFVSAHAGEVIEKVREGLVGPKARKWFEFRVPFTLQVARGDDVSEFPMVAHVMGMLAFPRYEEDSRMVLWRIAVSRPDAQ
ncbi:hypothetical protein [Salipiger mucosus]|uniref:hypothetical protein n=1 Tax=Salipiger mucosus TaxID=263378 RepID=UPI000364D85E|nr:hypothetical protein [Salipiger mucosus]